MNFSVGALWWDEGGGRSSMGKGNCSSFSVVALGVGLSIAFRALSLSAAMRLLSSISPPCGLRLTSSKTLLRSLLSICRDADDGSRRLGVVVGGMPSRHEIRARASLRGPTGFAMNPTLPCEALPETVRSNREECEHRTRTVGVFRLVVPCRTSLAMVAGLASFAIIMLAF